MCRQTSVRRAGQCRGLEGDGRAEYPSNDRSEAIAHATLSLRTSNTKGAVRKERYIERRRDRIQIPPPLPPRRHAASLRAPRPPRAPRAASRRAPHRAADTARSCALTDTSRSVAPSPPAAAGAAVFVINCGSYRLVYRGKVLSKGTRPLRRSQRKAPASWKRFRRGHGERALKYRAGGEKSIFLEVGPHGVFPV